MPKVKGKIQSKVNSNLANRKEPLLQNIALKLVTFIIHIFIHSCGEYPDIYYDPQDHNKCQLFVFSYLSPCGSQLIHRFYSELIRCCLIVLLYLLFT